MRRRLVAVLAPALLLATAACGGDDDQTEQNPTENQTDSAEGEAESEGEGDGDGELRTVTVGMLPILPTAALYAGIEEGFFADQGLELEIETGQGGAALLPAVESGQLEFSSGNPVSLLQAREQGLDIRAIAHWTSSVQPPDRDANAVMAGSDSGIESAVDLAGHTVAVNTLQGMGGLTIREAVRNDGGDPDAVEFVELGFPDMPAALEQGNVDAVWVPEPFVTILEGSGAHIVVHASQESVPGHPTQLFFTSGEVVESEPELVEAMTTAINETLELAEENPDAVLAAADFLDMDPELLNNVTMEAFGTDLRKDEVQQLGELMHQDGLLEEEPDVEGLYVE